MGIVWKVKEVTLKVPVWEEKNDTPVPNLNQGPEPSPDRYLNPTIDPEVSGWKSWVTRDMMGFLVLGMLVISSTPSLTRAS
jgi:hypothetical protein